MEHLSNNLTDWEVVDLAIPETVIIRLYEVTNNKYFAKVSKSDALAYLNTYFTESAFTEFKDDIGNVQLFVESFLSNGRELTIKNLRIEKANVRESSADCVATFLYFEDCFVNKQLTFKLKKEGGEWKIQNIIDRDGRKFIEEFSPPIESKITNQKLTENSELNQIISDHDLSFFVKLLAAKVHQQTVFPSDMFEVIRQFVNDLDQQLSNQLNPIIHHPDFKTLEASWHSLHFLVSNTNSNNLLKIKILQLTKKELLRDFERSLEFDQTYIFKKIHDDVYGNFAGQPYGVIIGNYEFDFSPQDMLILENFAKVAETAYAPFIAAVAPDTIAESSQFQRWQHFRQKPEAMFVSLCTPRVLLREIYGDDNLPAESFKFTEQITSTHDLAWGNAAFFFGAKLTETFSTNNWCVRIDGEENGWINTKIPSRVQTLSSLENSFNKILSDTEEESLRQNGFNVASKLANGIQFLQAVSCAEPLQSDDEIENTQLKEFVSLRQTFAVSRFAHYLKILTENYFYFDNDASIGGLEKHLSNWLSEYCRPETEKQTSAFDDSYRPLLEAFTEISNDIWKPDLHTITIYLRPGYQIEYASTPFLRTVKIKNISQKNRAVHPPQFKRKVIGKPKDTRAEISKTHEQNVRITYELVGDYKFEIYEIPFIAGVIGDFVGNTLEPLPRLNEQKFVEIDTNNFDEVLATFKPRVNFKVKNTLKNNDSELEVDLKFQCFEDFNPDNIVRQIEPLQQLVEMRAKLWELFDRVDRDVNLENLLLELINNPNKLNQILSELETNENQDIFQVTYGFYRDENIKLLPDFLAQTLGVHLNYIPGMDGGRYRLISAQEFFQQIQTWKQLKGSELIEYMRSFVTQSKYKIDLILEVNRDDYGSENQFAGMGFEYILTVIGQSEELVEIDEKLRNSALKFVELKREVMFEML